MATIVHFLRYPWPSSNLSSKLRKCRLASACSARSKPTTPSSSEPSSYSGIFVGTTASSATHGAPSLTALFAYRRILVTLSLPSRLKNQNNRHCLQDSGATPHTQMGSMLHESHSQRHKPKEPRTYHLPHIRHHLHSSPLSYLLLAPPLFPLTHNHREPLLIRQLCLVYLRYTRHSNQSHYRIHLHVPC